MLRRWFVCVVVGMFVDVVVRVAAAVGMHRFMDLISVRCRAVAPDLRFTATTNHTHRLSPD
jgi:hypothetical protein